MENFYTQRQPNPSFSREIQGPFVLPLPPLLALIEYSNIWRQCVTVANWVKHSYRDWKDMYFDSFGWSESNASGPPGITQRPLWPVCPCPYVLDMHWIIFNILLLSHTNVRRTKTWNTKNFIIATLRNFFSKKMELIFSRNNASMENNAFLHYAAYQSINTV